MANLAVGRIQRAGQVRADDRTTGALGRSDPSSGITAGAILVLDRVMARGTVTAAAGEAAAVVVAPFAVDITQVAALVGVIPGAGILITRWRIGVTNLVFSYSNGGIIGEKKASKTTERGEGKAQTSGPVL